MKIGFGVLIAVFLIVLYFAWEELHKIIALLIRWS
jgi:hypothetical protein